MSFETGRTRDEQSTLCSRGRKKEREERSIKNAKLYHEIGTEGKYSKFQRM
jgi:hypothetical protein